MLYVRDPGIQEIFAHEIWNPGNFASGIWYPWNTAQRIWNPTNDWSLESNAQNPESRCGIQNPRLSWIPLHEAREIWRFVTGNIDHSRK